MDLVDTNYYASFEGRQSLDINGNGPGVISQMFATVPGGLYSLNFAYANNPVTPEAEAQLEDRGVTILPDFVANAAAAFLFGGLLEKRLEPTLDSIFTVTSRQLRSTTRELLKRAHNEGVSNRRAAEEIAELRLRAHRT